ncbi:hypothetical protein [Pantoea piersonii]|uniref:hypothetical protein n=1 Tax=Pantoea piersonii TaxID=2364647 RepID=UPI0028996FF8|nr:hypothetical protein [Pantoea piersonii]
MISDERLEEIASGNTWRVGELTDMAQELLAHRKAREGWQLVPVEPTENMVIAGFESEPDESFSTDEEWEAYEAMSGCQQAAHRAKLCYAAMLAASPELTSD